MADHTILRVYLEAPMLKTARAGTFNFLNVLHRAVTDAGWRVEWHETGAKARERAPERDGYALFHAEAPTHDRALTFRRAYHYPFWQIEPVQQRWRFDVATSSFAPRTVDAQAAQDFVRRLRHRVLPGIAHSGAGDHVLVPLQGHLRRCRSFQTLSPIDMLDRIAETGQPVTATLHPNEAYDNRDHAALDALTQRHANLRLGGNTAALLPHCRFVATENSAVAFDGLLLGKPAVLFAQIDFHHICLNVADLGTAQALAQAATHAPDFERYLFWFLQEKAINATLPDAPARVLAAMRRGGWPI